MNDLDLKKIYQNFLTEILKIDDSKNLFDLQVKYLGKKGILTSCIHELKNMEKEDKAVYGRELNSVKTRIKSHIEEKKRAISEIELESQLNEDSIDVTQPGLYFESGYIHPLEKMKVQICAVFTTMGYDVVTGPEVESDYYNFEMLNIPKNHSARDMQDTFYIDDNNLLRTHTSPMQIRIMMNNKEKGPIRIVSPGKVYRRDEDDATHSHQFMQIEGLLIDEDISIGHLVATLEEFVKSIFGEDRRVRVRPSYFPFTEPSLEVDVDCFNCNGSGCNICKNTGWIEVLGAGMVHPEVLKMTGYDSKKYSGFAFGLGIERFVMLKYKIKDIRDFYTNDLRFISKLNSRDGGGF
ncbi:MAG: phenylalanine--tRNA ligase subunit alpha [Bacilli bacterium]